MLKHLWLNRRAVVEALIYWSGFGAAFEAIAHPAGAIILMYHSIAANDAAEFIDPPNRMSPELFSRQMAFLKENRHVVPLSAVIEQIKSGITPAAGTVCITFDDGYLDNLTVAAPILEKHNLPATLFLATGYIERTENQWADTLHWLISRRTSDILRIPHVDPNHFNLNSEIARSEILKKLHTYLLEATYQERKQVLEEIELQLSPNGIAPRLTLNWDDARELCKRYPFFEIGGHTKNHIDLQKHRGEFARSEINSCSDDIQRELGIRPQHFSFPYGRWCEETRQLVITSNWKAAVGINQKTRVNNTIDKFSIPRVEAPPAMTGFRYRTSGAYPGSYSLLRMN